MNNSTNIANDYAHGGKVKTSEARQLAMSYLDAIKTIERLRQDVLSLSGGERSQIKFNSYERNDWRVWTYKHRDGKSSASNKEIGMVNDLLKKLGAITVKKPVTQYSIEGGRMHVETFLLLNTTITEALQMAYDSGFDDGSNILQRLASGDASIAEYGAMTPTAV